MGDVPLWVSNSFPAIRIVLIILLVLLSLATVICIFLQPARADGAGVITGQASDTYYSKHKSHNLEGLMKKLTVIFASVAAFIAILFFVTILIYDPALQAAAPPAP